MVSSRRDFFCFPLPLLSIWSWIWPPAERVCVCGEVVATCGGADWIGVATGGYLIHSSPGVRPLTRKGSVDVNSANPKKLQHVCALKLLVLSEMNDRYCSCQLPLPNTQPSDKINLIYLKTRRKGGIEELWIKMKKQLPYLSIHQQSRCLMTALKQHLRHSRAAQLYDSSLGLRNDKNLQCGNSVDTTQHQRSQIWVLVAQTSIREREETISVCRFSSRGAKIVLILSISVHCRESNRALIH